MRIFIDTELDESGGEFQPHNPSSEVHETFALTTLTKVMIRSK